MHSPLTNVLHFDRTPFLLRQLPSYHTYRRFLQKLSIVHMNVNYASLLAVPMTGINYSHDHPQ